MNLFIKKINQSAIIPQRGTNASAGFDISACLDEPIEIAPGKIVKIPTGIITEPDNENIVLLMFPRSGLSTNHGITLANCIGVIDSDYRGEIIVPLINNSNKIFLINHGMRIAQMLIIPIIIPDIIEKDNLNETARSNGGFGSTGM